MKSVSRQHTDSAGRGAGSDKDGWHSNATGGSSRFYGAELDDVGRAEGLGSASNASSDGRLNMDGERLASIAKGSWRTQASSAHAVQATVCSFGLGTESAFDDIAAASPPSRAPSVSGVSDVLPSAETLVWERLPGGLSISSGAVSPAPGSMGVDAVAAAAASLRTKLEKLTEVEVASSARSCKLDIDPHMGSLEKLAAAHVQQKRHEIAHSQHRLQRAMEEVRACQRREERALQEQVGALRAEFDSQLLTLQREFFAHAQRNASQLAAAVEHLQEQHQRALQRKTEMLLYGLTKPPGSDLARVPESSGEGTFREEISIGSGHTAPNHTGSESATGGNRADDTCDSSARYSGIGGSGGSPLAVDGTARLDFAAPSSVWRQHSFPYEFQNEPRGSNGTGNVSPRPPTDISSTSKSGSLVSSSRRR
eukprot:COSAG05_NODE_3336_length_2144_cov_1.283619_1_plen_424_part_00